MSLDDAGTLCWWDTSRDSSCSGSERLTHSFRLEEGERCVAVAAVGFGVDLDRAQDRREQTALKRCCVATEREEPAGPASVRRAESPRDPSAAVSQESIDAATACAALA